MTVTVYLKEPVPNGQQVFEFRETALFDDAEAGWAVLAYVWCEGIVFSVEDL